MADDEHEATKGLARHDENVDHAIETLAAPVAGLVTAAIAETFYPGTGTVLGLGAASLVSRMRLEASRRLASFARLLESRAHGTMDDVFGEMNAEQGHAFRDAYENVVRAIDPRAAPALGRLVAEVIFDDKPRDAFFRNVGHLFVDADAAEWDSLERLFGVLGESFDMPPWSSTDFVNVDTLSVMRVENPRRGGTKDALMISGKRGSHRFGPVYIDTQGDESCMRLLGKAGLVVGLVDKQLNGIDLANAFDIDRSVAVRIRRLITEP